MKQYLSLLSDVMTNGTDKPDRTGTGIRSVFGRQMRFDLQQGFPLLTTKKVHIPSVVHELLWFLSGSTNIQYLKDNNVRIWDEWATENGEIGPMYGKQWTAWEKPNGETINQIQQVIDTINTNPNSRRMIVSAWNPANLPDESISPQQNVAEGRMALAACHAFFQFYVSEGKLSCQIYQRSADFFLGVPFNIASYALLTHMIAQQTDLDVGELVWTGGDVHVYSNHFTQVATQLEREPLTLCSLNIKRKPNSIFDYVYDDFEFINYEHHPHIPGKVAV